MQDLGIERETLVNELVAMSHKEFDIIGLGGIYGPTKWHYDHRRPKHFPKSRALMLAMDLPPDRHGWGELMAILGFVGDQKLRKSKPVAEVAEEKTEFVGDRIPANALILEQDCVSEVALGNGWYERTTRTLYLVR